MNTETTTMQVFYNGNTVRLLFSIDYFSD